MQAGLEAFDSVSAGQSSGSGDIPASTLESAAPDQTLWSEERIQAYQESLATGGDAPLAVLRISNLSIEVPVYDGEDEHNLNRGVARVRGTARIGRDGNLGIAGHRDGFFRGLKDIAMNDVIELQTHQGIESYRVVSTQIVKPSDVEVLAPTPDEKTLTLVTCYPFYFVGSAPERFIVKAVAEQNLVNNSMRES